MKLLRKFYDYGYDDYGGGGYGGYGYPPQGSGYSNNQLWGGIGSGALSGAAAGTAIAPGWGTLIGGVVGAGEGLITGEEQKSKANKLLGQPRPGYNIPKEALDNQQIAQNLALTGLPSAQYEQAMKNIQRQSNQAISSAQDRRAGIGLIGTIQQKANDATGNLDAQNAEARRKNIGTLLQQNQNVAGYRDKQFDWNQKQKYQQNYNYGMQLLGAGNQNIVGGIDKGVAGLMRSGAFNGLFGSSPNFSGSRPAGWYGSDPITMTNVGDNSIVPQPTTGGLFGGSGNDLGAMDYELMNQ